MKILKVKNKKYLVEKITERKGEHFMKLIPYEEGKFDRIIKEIIDKLKSKVDAETILKQALSNLEWREILEIYKKLKRGVKPKAKEGCYEINIGSSSIYLVG